MKLTMDGAELNYEVDGSMDSPAVLLWNGANCTLRMWDLVVERLSDQFRLIRFNVRGVGGSTPADDPESQYTFEQYAVDANLILEECGVTTCHVWGMAWGSRAALAFCTMNVDRVLTASLFDASIGPADVPAQVRGHKRAMELQLAAGIDRFPRPDGVGAHEFPDEVPLAMAAARKFDLPAAVPGLTVPVLVATGDNDPNLPSSRELVAAAPNARLVVMENVGHGSVLQRPDLTTRVFLEFQESVRAIGSPDSVACR